jgi:hypothetical protein
MSQQNQTKPRKWLIEGEPIVIDGYEHDVLRDTLDECVMMLRRVGGAVCVKTPGGTLILGSIRERLGIDWTRPASSTRPRGSSPSGSPRSRRHAGSSPHLSLRTSRTRSLTRRSLS